ncbi:glycosyltransferase family 2 protein [Nonlabens sp. SCSIO 43208]|uniref:glycosyltransferase family 2 protein n=1 Tax=Nonlabens sp. SCSIO 43208 TaxID=2793009 RepID=UPI003D6AAF3F
MQRFPIIRVIIPAYNEQDSIGHVIKDIPKIVTEVVVCSNNSSDDTVLVARNAGATVVEEPNPGYGNACLKAMDYIAQLNERTDIIVFLDGDYSDYPEQLIELVNPIINDDIDVVIGARVSHLREKGSMTLPQIFGNWLATTLMKWMFASKFTDLGPFRAIKYDKLLALNMQDKTYGWTVELQLKALKNKYTYCEIPMNYRNRIGVSKVSGTVKGAIFAGVKILTWIFKYGIRK